MPTQRNLSSKKLGSGGKNSMMTVLGSETKNSPSAGQNLSTSLGSSPVKRLRGTTSQGAKVMGLMADTDQLSGPGEPPPGFVGGTTSASEWYIYWALEKVLGPEEQGGWTFQNSMLGGRSTRGGAVVDFVVNQDPLFIGIRLQSSRFHITDNSYQKSHDREQLVSLTDWDFIVVDIYEGQFLEDETGAAAIQVVISCINQEIQPDPFGTGFIV